MRKIYPWACLIILVFATSLRAQSRNSPPVSTVVVVLEKALDSKSAVVGQEVALTTLTDVIVNGEVVVPKGSKLLAHTADVDAKPDDQRKSVLAIRIDKAISRNGGETPLQAIIAAIRAPADNSLSSDPQYGMLHSNEPKMVGSGAGSTASTGNLSAGSKTSSTAAVATAQVKGGMDASGILSEDSQGAIGYEGVTMSWFLTAPPPLTIFASKAKIIKLQAGTQMLLRMAEPHVPH